MGVMRSGNHLEGGERIRHRVRRSPAIPVRPPRVIAFGGRVWQNGGPLSCSPSAIAPHPVMNDKRLLIYLNDHLALMVGEGELAARCRSSNKGTGLSEFLQQLAAEIHTQKSVVEELIRRLGGRESRVKQ